MKESKENDFLRTARERGSILGLARIQELLSRLGNPQEKLRFVHVAGTNGKGSVCAICASVLQEAGYRTGRYTSPHLSRRNESIQVNGREISDRELEKGLKDIETAAEGMREVPTEFELMTALSFLYFCEKECEIVVLEVGLGGRTDATNVIPCPLVAGITHIALEHMGILGNTLSEIAAQKAGIIKEGGQVVLAAQEAEVVDKVRSIVREKRAHLIMTEPNEFQLLSQSLEGQRFCYRSPREWTLSLAGDYQRSNVMTAMEILRLLRESHGFRIPEQAMDAGLRKLRWPGRFERLCQSPCVILDGAHNPDGAGELALSLAQIFPGKKAHFVMGVMADKNYDLMLKSLAPLAQRFIAVTPENSRALPGEKLAGAIAAHFSGEIIPFPNVREGLSYAIRTTGADELLVVFGSLYQAGEVRRFFKAF